MIAQTFNTVTTWNGPTCPTCLRGYLDAHKCAAADLGRMADLYRRLADKARGTTTTDRTATCPCRRENGGSGVCGCVLGGTTTLT